MEWIKVSEKLPDHTDYVLVWGTRSDNEAAGWWKGYYRAETSEWRIISEYHDSSIECAVTHWIEIEPPKE